jgi:16S rRNA (uracil1498-N3)-methyltransferase
VLRPATLFAQACEQAGRRSLSLIPWEGEKSTSLRAVLGQSKSEAGTATPKSRPFGVNLFIGPEGGFSTAEIVQARGYGLIPVTLGPRLLRAETAGLVAATAILYELRDLE